jgi:hypothetical protein
VTSIHRPGKLDLVRGGCHKSCTLKVISLSLEVRGYRLALIFVWVPDQYSSWTSVRSFSKDLPGLGQV